MSNFPIDVTVRRLVEFHGLADALCLQELGRLPTHTDGDSIAEIILLKALQGQTGEQIQAFLHAEPEAVAHRTKPLTPAVVAVVPRAKLPPFPTGSFDHDLPSEPPHTRDFMRADTWGVEVPGLPFVPRGSSEHPERLLTYFDYKYSRDFLSRGLDEHARRGYTHWVRSWPDARSDGGQSIERFIEDCLFIKTKIQFVHVKLASKDFDPRDQTPDQWAERVDAVMDALVAAKAVDEFGVWEWDAFNVPGKPTIETWKHIGQKAHASGCSFWAHFLPEHTSWFAPGEPRGRFGFWSDLGSDVDGLDYQSHIVKLQPMTSPSDPQWDVPMLQARLVDTLTQFGKEQLGHKLRAFELTAMQQFTQDHPTEDEANLISFLACCTRGLVPVFGYGNGARRPGGEPL